MYVGVATRKRRIYAIVQRWLPTRCKYSPHALSQGNEDHVEDEEQRRADIFLQDIPSVIFRANAIASFAPVIICQSRLVQSVEACCNCRLKLTLQKVLKSSSISSRRVDKPAACA